MSTHTVWLRRAHLSPQPRSASQACGFVASHLSQHGLGYLVAEVQLAVSELVNDALSHSRTTIDVTVEEQLFCVILTVHDRSPAPEVVRSDGVAETDGHRFHSAEGLGVDRGVLPHPEGGTSVWVMFALRPPEFGEWVSG